MMGWISLHRKLLDSRVFNNPYLLKVWIWCLLRANHKEEWVSMVTGRGTIEVHVSPGQFIFGRDSAAKELKMPSSSVRNRMKKLKTIENLDIKEDRQFSIITILNWSAYQDIKLKEDSEEDYQRTGKGQAKDTDNNDNNVNKIHTIVFEHWNAQNIIVHRKLSDKDKQTINGALKDYTQESILRAITNYSGVLQSPDHFFKFKWALRDFLQRGLRKFANEADPWNNFMKGNNGTRHDEKTERLLEELD
jgi:hypothetical protein